MARKRFSRRGFPFTNADAFAERLQRKAVSLLKQGSEPSDVIDYFVKMGHDREFARRVAEKAYNFLTTPIGGK